MLNNKLFLFLGISLFPLYLFPSGLPQVSDFILLLFIISSFYSVLIKKDKAYHLPHEWTALVILILLVSLVWAIKEQYIEFMKPSLFWVFNFLLSMSLFNSFKNNYDQTLKLVYYSVSFAIIISTIAVFSGLTSGGVRAYGFFNNPNQLAFFSLLAVLIISLINDFKLNSMLLIVLLIFSILSIFLSASLSAMLAIMLIISGYALKNFTVKGLIVSAVVAPVVFGSVIYFGGDTLVNNYTTRVARLDTKVNDMADERNYNRVFNNIEYTILGAGEGLHERFGGATNEIHSSYANLVFSYGIASLFLFLLIIFKMLARMPVYALVASLAPFLYSVTHMGLRSVYFWVFIVVCLSLYPPASRKLRFRT
jgi:hypothetical protein